MKKNKMNILVVGPSSTRSKGGMATVIREIADDKEFNEKMNIDIYESFIDGSFVKRLWFSIYSYIRFLVTKKGYDIYHIHAASRGSTFRKGYYVKLIKKWGGKVILHIHGAQYMEFYNQCSEKKKKRIIDILKSADMVIALSEDWKKKFDKKFGLTNCVVLPNGIDTEKYSNAVSSLEQHKNEFVFLGRLGERKGAYDLVNAIELAVKQNSNIKVYMAGDGEIEKVRGLIHQKKLQNNIILVGWVDFERKIELLKKSATLVLPSYNEGLPMAILEGMAAGKAIISTTVGAIPEVIEDGNGILIEPGNIKLLSDAIVECSNNLEKITLMAQNNIKKIDNQFSMKTMHKKLIQYYENVLK